MKRTLLAICIGTMALAVAAPAANVPSDEAGTGRGKARKAAVTKSQTKSQAGNTGVQRRQFRAQQQQKTSARSVRQHRSVGAESSGRAAITQSNTRPHHQATRERSFRHAQQTDNTAVTGTTTRERFGRGQNVQRNQAATFSRDRNVTVNRTRNINRDVTIVNNWRSNRFAAAPYRAFYNYNRTWHDRSWWHSHHDRIIFVNGFGWWFWNAGFWFPAWGYDPYYRYPYDGPIYGYNSLSPDQIVANVQVQLRNDGYYDGPVDGILGPRTRYALAAFQADHGLAVTSAVDQPTLATLGLV